MENKEQSVIDFSDTKVLVPRKKFPLFTDLVYREDGTVNLKSAQEFLDKWDKEHGAQKPQQEEKG